MKKLMVEVTLIAVTEDFSAKAGDHLMVLNNKLLGVYTGRDATPVKNEARAIAGRKGGLEKAARSPNVAKYQNSQPFPSKEMAKVRLQVVNFVAANPDCTIRQIAEHLGATHGENRRRYQQLHNIMINLVNGGNLTSHIDKNKTRRYLPPAPPAIAAAS